MGYGRGGGNGWRSEVVPNWRPSERRHLGPLPVGMQRAGGLVERLSNESRFTAGRRDYFFGFMADCRASHISPETASKPLNSPAPRSHSPPSIVTTSPVMYAA